MYSESETPHCHGDKKVTTQNSVTGLSRIPDRHKSLSPGEPGILQGTGCP